MAYNDKLDRTNVVTVSVASVLIVLVVFVLGVIGNNHASDATARIAVACVSHGGKWIDDTADCIR